MDPKLVDGMNRRVTPSDPAEVRRLLASIVEFSDDAIYGMDLEGVITSWNGGAHRVYGYAPDEMIGSSILQLVPEEFGEDFAGMLFRIGKGEGLQHYETVRLGKGGRRIPISLTISPIRDDSGTIIGASTIARDLSPRRIDETRWRVLAQFGEVVGGAMDVDRLLGGLAEILVRELADYCVTYRLDEGKIRRIGAAHADPGEAEVVRRLFDLAPPTLQDPAGAGAAMRTGQALLAKRINEAELERLTVGASEYLEILRTLRPISSMVLPLGARGRIVGAIAFATTPLSNRHYTEADLAFGKELADRAALALDNARLYQASQAELSRRVAAEDALRKRYDELRILYQLTDSVGRASAVEEIYSEVLDGLEQALGVSRASILLFDTDEALRFKAWRGLSDGYRRVVEGHSPWSPQTQDPAPIVIPDVAAAADLEEPIRSVILAEGIRALAFFPLVFRAQLLGKFMLYFDAPRDLDAAEIELARTIGGTVAFAITKMRDEQSVREAKESAERASEAKSQFLGVMSHELRTPLNAVLGYSDLLLLETKGPLTAGQRQQVERIKTSANHQLGMVNELLTYTRLEAGREEARLVDTDARRIVSDVAELVRPQAEAKGIRLRIHLPDRPIAIRTDPAKLRQIALNLVGNATKYTESGEIGVRASCEGHRFHLEVRDTGPGIPESMLDYIFEPFAQVDESRTRQSGGTGLGLAISRQVASLLKGEVHVVSRVDEGSTFTLSLPNSCLDPD